MIPDYINSDQILKDLQTSDISVSQAPSKQDKDNVGYYEWVTKESEAKGLGHTKIVALDNTEPRSSLRDLSQYLLDNTDADTVIAQGTNYAGVSSTVFSRAQIASAENELQFNTGSPGTYAFLEGIEQYNPQWSIIYATILLSIVLVVVASIAFAKNVAQKNFMN